MNYEQSKEQKKIMIEKRKSSVFLKFTRKFMTLYIIVTMAFLGGLIYSDLLPKKYMLIVTGVVVLLSLFIYFPMKSWKFKRSRRLIAFIISLMLICVYSFSGIYLYQTLHFIDNIASVGNTSQGIRKPVDVTKDSYNIYITGLDTVGDINQKSRSDVNMIATINPRKNTVVLTSIPRDYYIPVGENLEFKDKLTHTGINGAKATVEAVERLTGLKINYYFKVNYSTFIKLIDSIGGVNINSAFEFKEKKLNDKYAYFKKGSNQVNGEEALAFVRARYPFKDGDLERNRNQQRAIEAVVKKLSSNRILLLRYNKIISALGNTIETNLSSKEIASIMKFQFKDMPKWKIIHQGLDGDISLMPSYAMNGLLASVILPNEDSVKECVTNIKKNMK